MGFQHKPKNIVLTFDDTTDYAGFECALKGLTLGEYMEVVGLSEVSDSFVANQLRKFAESLISWNLDDAKGKPIPATKENVFKQEKTFMIKIAEEWIAAVDKVAAPLEQSSTDGDPSVAASIPMATLSESLAS